MEKIWIMWLFLSIFSQNSQSAFKLVHQVNSEKRIIRVAVWNDAKYPVEAKIIKENLAICFEEYKYNADIIFKWDRKILIYKPKTPFLFISDPDKDCIFFTELQRKCIVGKYIYFIGENKEKQIKNLNQYLVSSPDIELKIFFSDIPTENIYGRAISQHDGIIAVYCNSKTKTWIYEEGIGFVIDFLPQIDAGGNSLIADVLNHEIGHLFSLGHLTDRESFMYEYCLGSYGKWTEEVIKIIKENKLKKWQEIESPINW